MPLALESLNYHHLLYFYVVAREGSVKDACAVLHVSQPTVSTQINELQRTIGLELFAKRGRGLQLTETGQIVYRYADEIFGIAREMLEVMRGRRPGKPLTLVVGVPDAIPKLIVHALLKPALRLPEPMRLICREGHFENLVADLAMFHVDVVLSDVPVGPTIRVRAFSHLLGQCGVTFFGAPELAAKLRGPFPQCLNDAPFLMPGEHGQLRRALEQWFDEQDIRPQITGEFQDTALMKVFGQSGLGVFPSPSAVEQDICDQYGLVVIGRTDAIRESYYAISVERRLKHPAVVALTEGAREHVFRNSHPSGPRA